MRICYFSLAEALDFCHVLEQEQVICFQWFQIYAAAVIIVHKRPSSKKGFFEC